MADGSAKITSTIQNNANLYDAADTATPLVAVSKGGTEEKDGLTVTKAGVVGTNTDGSKYIDYTIKVNFAGGERICLEKRRYFEIKCVHLKASSIIICGLLFWR